MLLIHFNVFSKKSKNVLKHVIFDFMSEITKQIENVELKIKQLAKKFELIKEENKSLVKENIELREQLSVKKEVSDQAIKFEGADSFDEEVKAKMKEEIDSYIAELNQCIELVNSL